MRLAGKIGETLRALSVLALFLLNFSPVPLTAGPADTLVPLSMASICGDLGSDGSHPPCHACRFDGAADLPRRAVCPQPAFGVVAVSYELFADTFSQLPQRSSAQPRAPPVA